MRTRFSRIGALISAGVIMAAMAVPVAAAGPAPLTAIVTANDNGVPSAGKAWVRVLHGSPDAPKVDVYVGADLGSAAKVDALSGLSFGEISDYVEVDAGTYGVKVCATADPMVCPIEVAALALAADTKYTVAASDLLASIDANVFVDAPDTSESEDTQVRVVHLSADTPSVDVLTQAGDSIGVDGLTYPNATGYAKFPAADYDLKVCATADHAVCPIDPGALTLEAGKAYSVFAIGSLDALLAQPDTDTVSPTTSDETPATPWLLPIALGLLAITILAVRIPRRTER
jgi:Domain of unknown function (DUF4397)